MAVNEGSFIKLRFTGLSDGEVFDTTEEDKAKDAGIFNEQKAYEPIVVRLGGMHIIPGLDEALIGKEVGEKGTVEIPPEKAYGPHDESLVKSAPVKNFAEKPQVGMRISSEGQEGVIVNVVGKRAVVDFNHVLAGKTLTYEYEIEAVVEDPAEQVKGLINLYSGKDMDLEITDGVLTILLPPGINYDKRWGMARGILIHQVFEFISGIDEVILKESYKRPAMPEDVEEIEEPEEIEEADEPSAAEESSEE
ncbi:FKBP-type peptidyl-prolyl cis-trans isomerase [Methanogenium organophilum]|uniref:Peptidyl-prolyl cis-trans isomerase n=1 Tax=Methanogenium organophilum TaxID=2199 RepID=A0A9X9S3X7_METOG|nr:peptidylprolyl isomerase [Methanogenium organophilum]WAI01027.1 peptidylprolyl isomerase [Methanogenium organophilum]